MADTTTDDITPAGSDTTSYSTGETSFHQHDYAWRWVGPATGGDWADPSNWVLTDAGQPVDTSTPAFSGIPIPQSEQNADVNVGTYDNTIPNVVVSNSVLYNQIRSLTVWQNGVLKITAQGGNGNVFATAGVENYGTIIIDTPSKVELGGVTAGDGTLTILNNNGNVTLDDAYLNNGTLNLVNSTLGTLATPISAAGGTINLQQNSTLIANLYGEGSTINVDPATVNTLYVNDRFSNGSGSVQNTVINGVSENTHFGILSGSSKPVSATYEANTDGSYTLTITLDNGHAITYPTVNVADGYTPAAQATIVQDGTNGWLIEDAGTSTAPASYVTSDLHQQLAATAAAAAAAGGDTTQYSSSATNYHTHDNTWRWTGSETGGDWYDPKNWTLYDSTGNVVDTSGSSFSGNAVPQSEQNADVSVGTYNSAIQNVVVANAPSYNQIRSLSVWQNGTLEITAQADSTYSGYVFAAAGFENDGKILINTAGRVELGGISANRNGGTLTIMNNDNNVVFDTNKVNNAGTINLINAALGAATNPLSISGGTVNLSQDSSLFLSPGEYISTINVDPNTINTVYVEANFLLQTDSSNAQSVVVNGVSANTHFGISGVSSAPTAATYTPNADGSYTLQVTLADGRLLTFGNIHTADGFVPATNASIVQDGTNGWVVEDEASPATLAASASTVLHQPLAATASVAAATTAGSDTTSYSTGETSFHQHDYAWRWVGPATGGDWADPSNWVLTDAGQPVDTSTPAFSGIPIPQSEQNADVNVGTYDNTIPNVVVSNSVLYNQIRSLTVWQNGVLKITAQGGNGNVFATAGVENYGTIIIDTPSKVELGGVTAGDGTLTILNNNGNVTLDDAYLNNGTLNLVNSTLGTLATPISVAGGTINLQQNSTLIANLYGEGSTINVDPATVNTLYVNDRFSNGSGSVQNTVINGVSENTHFGILSGSSKPVSATYEANTDGSYTLTITLDNGHAITYPTVNVADGYTPAAQATIVQDGTNGWLIEDAGTSTAPASYVTSDLHQQLAATAAAAAAAGGDTTQYSSSATNYHTHDNTWRWTGSETGGDWYDPKNWTLYDSTGNVVDTSGSSFSGNAVPQSEQNADVSVGTYNSAIQNVVVANAPSYNQIRSLSVWQNGTLEITAQADSTYSGYVFAAAGFENDGKILINTAGRVELGGISANRNGGTLTIMNNDNNVVFDTNKVNNAGTINLINAALGAATNPLSISGGTVNLSQDSSLFLSPGEYISTINVDPNTINTVYVEANFLLQTDSSNAQSVVVNGVSANTHFGISGVSSAPTAATYTPNADGSYTLQVTLADGRLLTFGNIHTADGFVPATNASIVQDGTNGWVVEDNGNAPCFLAGSMIRTPEGDVAVETLRLGSTVLAFVNGETVERKVTWAGRSHMIAKAGLADAEAGYPVRIMQGALAEGVPYKDMLVTPEHCLFINGGFIPARMLVNGRSVVYDRTIAVYDYFHVETAEHSVIMADGMLTESYLDTGNRQSFRQDGSVVSLGGRERNWNDDAAAPLSVSRDVVEPIFREIEARAIAAGLENTVDAPALTEDADLYLVASTGQAIHQVRTANGRAMFMIPSDVTGVRIVSRTSSPSETVGPFVDDRRQLGVLVGEVTLFDSGNTIRIDQHLTDAGLSGWDVQENTPVRWTNGNAMLPLTARQPNSLGMLAIQILAAGPYLATTSAEETALTA